MQHDPRVVFERMFGDSGSTDPVVQRAPGKRLAGLLDSVSQELKRLVRGLGPGDNAKLNDILMPYAISSAASRGGGRDSAYAGGGEACGIPDDYEEACRLMYDLFALAYQADLTRVITFMIGPELSGQNYPMIAFSMDTTRCRITRRIPLSWAKLTKINTYHVTLFARFLKARSTPDGDGSLLDHMILIYGAAWARAMGTTP